MAEFGSPPVGIDGSGFTGAGAGADPAGGAGASRPPSTDGGPCWPRIPSAMAPSMNSTAHTAVARESTVAPLRQMSRMRARLF